MKIYTKFGDKGDTQLFSGEVVKKNHPNVDCYGYIDELNSMIGLLKVKSVQWPEVQNELYTIQNRLFVIGSHLATLKEETRSKLPQLKENSVFALEKSIDQMTETLPPLKNFILPGGSEASSIAHICRTLCRNVERKTTLLEGNYGLYIQYLNRLSDYFFTLSRFVNNKLSITESEWNQDI